METTKKKVAKKPGRFVMVTTEHRGVFAGELRSHDKDARRVVLDGAIMAIRFGTADGVLQLADTGPTASSKLSAKAPDIELEKVTMVAGVTDAARAAWDRYAK